MAESAYKEACKKACNWCAEGSPRSFEAWRQAWMHRIGEINAACTAPTLEAFAEHLAERVEQTGDNRGHHQEREMSHEHCAICSFQAVEDVNRKTRYEDLKATVLKAGRFSAFEAGANKFAAALFTRLCRDPELEMDHSAGYPWTLVRRKAVAARKDGVTE